MKKYNHFDLASIKPYITTSTSTRSQRIVMALWHFIEIWLINCTSSFEFYLFVLARLVRLLFLEIGTVRFCSGMCGESDLSVRTVVLFDEPDSRLYAWHVNVRPFSLQITSDGQLNYDYGTPNHVMSTTDVSSKISRFQRGHAWSTGNRSLRR